MSTQDEFPTLTKSQLTRDEIVAYLLEQKRRGYDVFQDPERKHVLILLLDELHRINFNIGGSLGCQIQGEVYGSPFAIANVSNMAELRSVTDAIAQQVIGSRWSSYATRLRLNESTPATNLASVAALIGGSSVEAVFDPYLENRSLIELLDILSFGNGSIAGNIRVLSTAKTTTGKVPRLTKAGFDAWLAQLGINGELRLMGNSEHRRFLLLSGGQSLLLGPSLNSLHKNEAVRLEADVEDRAFFDQIWVKATPIK
ncbi:hypothetical protein [Trichocoleus sp. FACHB-262]|uniref:hypothetical protein n=1 Tax=Trichocoleus sp. FACHB-262 TaxID=2692869 RepID=UPI0016859760|nr:hypothetical protein [Trichocoleus sp. FACHB-262]MBD2121125.1 hypothetical protein [Trichocoleus sp. FACHB-262]